MFFYNTLRSTTLNGCIPVSPCPSVHLWTEIVSAVYLPQYYLHILSTNLRMCVACLSLWTKFDFWQFLLIWTFHFVLCPCDESVKGWFIRVVIAVHDDTTRWFKIHTFRLQLQFCVFGLFGYCTFSLSLCGDIKYKVDSFLVQSLLMAGNSKCWCILATGLENWLHCGHRLLVFLFCGILA